MLLKYFEHYQRVNELGWRAAWNMSSSGCWDKHFIAYSGSKQILTFPVPCIIESCIEIKIKLNFYFHTSLGASKSFRKAFKAFIKPFEAPQRSEKIKIWIDFLSSFGTGTGRVNNSKINIYSLKKKPTLFNDQSAFYNSMDWLT